MFIDDEVWDKMIGESCDIVDAVRHLAIPKESEFHAEIQKRQNLYYSCANILQDMINLENARISLDKIKYVDDSKLFIIKWSLKQLFTFKRKSRNCRKSR